MEFYPDIKKKKNKLNMQVIDGTRKYYTVRSNSELLQEDSREMCCFLPASKAPGLMCTYHTYTQDLKTTNLPSHYWSGSLRLPKQSKLLPLSSVASQNIKLSLNCWRQHNLQTQDLGEASSIRTSSYSIWRCCAVQAARGEEQSYSATSPANHDDSRPRKTSPTGQ